MMARSGPLSGTSAAARRLRVVDDRRELCNVCDHHRAQQLGMCTRCLDAHHDLTVYDAQVETIRQAARRSL